MSFGTTNSPIKYGGKQFGIESKIMSTPPPSIGAVKAAEAVLSVEPFLYLKNKQIINRAVTFEPESIQRAAQIIERETRVGELDAIIKLAVYKYEKEYPLLSENVSMACEWYQRARSLLSRERKD